MNLWQIHLNKGLKTKLRKRERERKKEKENERGLQSMQKKMTS